MRGSLLGHVPHLSELKYNAGMITDNAVQPARRPSDNPYQVILATPFARLGIVCHQEQLTKIDFLPNSTPPMNAAQPFAQYVCEQIKAYLSEAKFQFSLPVAPRGTAYQQRVWRALCAIPSGETRCYGDLATALHSSPRAVGQACGANPIPIVIPCHRVLSKTGWGGFMHHRAGEALAIKRYLLAFESAITPEIENEQ